jgi:hypothetical protein
MRQRIHMIQRFHLKNPHESEADGKESHET